jgi:hypothetical protein
MIPELAVAVLLAQVTVAKGETRAGEVVGEECPPGTALLSFAEASARRDEVCRQLGQWDVARLAGGGAMDGSGYGCGAREKDARPLGNALCVGAVLPPAPLPAIPTPSYPVGAIVGPREETRPAPPPALPRETPQGPPPETRQKAPHKPRHETPRERQRSAAVRARLLGKVIALRADNGDFFSRCNGCQPGSDYQFPDSLVVKTEEGSPPWSRFLVVDAGAGKVALRADTGKFVGRCPECVPGGSVPDSLMVYGQGPRPPPYAQFTLESLPGAKVALRSDSGKYVGRCHLCSPQATVSETVTVHGTNPLEEPWAQWTISEVR